MLLRTDPFRELDRLTEQVFNGVRRPAAMPMDAWREDGSVRVELDLPGVDPDSVDLKVERDVLTIQAERKPSTREESEVLISERPRGTFTRQLFLGENLATEHIEATYEAGVLSLRVPVAEQAKSRKIEISGGGRKELRS
ncbi:heat-shock protein Hsp20 [Streptomyces agglomeratus]|uniref:Heat-shock protein Hsp20 n=1 Tax=Streptomyces agglomeratus TaxID=285458 RepID=A0A1E5PG19_9ACTN|nr:Hsp20/alpha crystallin family protein [Streptomyces agglomeratus]OEJ28490.1 heat-shock protein Hsp20 [Streptomyces agglomeratus]OEJ37447.1 heat-shock protein Hsp20 [Streptomyces agglomeratus]OEJ48169.1 heat-shock protein Hsp20 [Streptomyces agglomeratus]OEJ49988.1 heat-shock protein Hsp20 [Streptomyces agglomeratus]OEJ57316.1 heat-shock protein Hsp20 [Streptomyces agglomeratus]